MVILSDESIQKLMPLKQSFALGSLYSFLSNSPALSSSTIEIGFPNCRYSQGEHYHEAGYDAYITGYCYAKILNFLKKEQMDKYKNILYSFKSPFSINLAGKEELSANVSFVTIV